MYILQYVIDKKKAFNAAKQVIMSSTRLKLILLNFVKQLCNVIWVNACYMSNKVALYFSDSCWQDK